MRAMMTSQNHRSGWLAHAGAVVLAAWSLSPATCVPAGWRDVRLLPGEFTLTGPAARQALLFEAFTGDNATEHRRRGRRSSSRAIRAS